MAIQRALLTDSLSSQLASSTTIIGVTNRKAVLSASGMIDIPAIAKPVVPTSISALAVSASGRCVAISLARIDGARKITIRTKCTV